MLNNELKVKKLKSYKKPNYPSFMDPDPTQHPSPVDYPYSKKLLSTVLMISMAYSVQGEEKEAAANTFTKEFTGLPYHSSPYGTGRPSRMSEKEAVAVLKKVFKEEGINLKAGGHFKEGGVEFDLSEYDEEKGIGYVWGNWNSLDDDAVINWMKSGLRKNPVQVQPYLIDQLKDKKEAARILEIKDKKEQAQAYLKAYDIEQESESKKKLSLKEISQLEVIAKDKKKFVLVLSQYDPRLIQRAWDPVITPEIKKKLAAASSEEERKEILRNSQQQTADAILKTLEKDVRSYINWAKSQGLQ